MRLMIREDLFASSAKLLKYDQTQWADEWLLKVAATTLSNKNESANTGI